MKTPQISIPELAAALHCTSEVWLKQEDKHHLGSHKGRSIPHMIHEYHHAGKKNFVISSSGNAALAAAWFVQDHNKNHADDALTLKIFIGTHIDPTKHDKLLHTLHDPHITLEQVATPKKSAFAEEKNNQAVWLRQSSDDLALVGYHGLAEELSKIPNLAAVFVPTSSGTTAQGLHDGFKKLGLNPQIHIVQTDTCHTLIAPNAEKNAAPSIATAIVDKVGRRKTVVQTVLKNSQGSGWIATNEQITNAVTLVKNSAQIDISPNSALSIVGLTQAIARGDTWHGPVACLITGP